MDLKKVKCLYKKEIMDVLRDKKTILTMVVLPVVLYPLLFVVIMQVMMMINTSQQEQTYYIAFDQVAEADSQALMDWIDGDGDDLDYAIEVKDSKNPKRDMDNEKIDAYITTTVTGEQVIYEIHFLSAVTNSSSVADMLEEEIDSYSRHRAEKNIRAEGLSVEKMLYPVTSELTDQSSSESSMGNLLGSFIPFLMIISILLGCMYPAIDTTAGEKERGTLETLLTLPIGNMELIVSKFLSVATIAVVTVFFNVLSMGCIAAYLFTTMNSMGAGMEKLHLGSFVPAILIAVVCILAFALLMSALVMCVCAFAKSYKEANNYITPLMLVVMLTGYIGFIPNLELSRETALIPVANICLLMKALLSFKYDFFLIGLVLLSNVLYAFVAVWFLGKIYNSESILFGESASELKIFERRKNIKKGSIPSVQEALLVLLVAILLMLYVGGIVSLSDAKLGLLMQQLLFMAGLPILVCVYIKADMCKVFRIHLPKGKHILAAVLMFFGVISANVFVSNIMTKLFPNSGQNISEQFTAILDGVPFWGALLLIALLPAVCEEIMFRGYLLTAFGAKMKLLPAILWVSILFGFSHMSLIKVLSTAVLGMGLAYTAYRSDSIFTSSVIHFLNNGFAVFVMYYGENISWINDDKLTIPLMAVAVVVMFICIPAAVWLLKEKKNLEEKE